MGQARHSSSRSASVESRPYSATWPFSVRAGTGGCGRATTRHVPQPVKGPERSAALVWAGLNRPCGLIVSFRDSPLLGGKTDNHEEVFTSTPLEQIVAKLDKARSMKASGSTVAEVCRDLGVSEETYRRWVKQYGEMSGK